MKVNRNAAVRKSRPSLVAALVLGCGLFIGNSNAQWVVNDPMVNTTSLLDMGQSWTEFVEQAHRWQRTIQEYQDALTSLSSLMNDPSGMLSNFTSDMTKVPEDYGDKVNCRKPPGSGELSLATLFSAVLPDANKNLANQQYMLCLQANHLRNMKYNELVLMVSEAKKRSEDVDKFIARAKESNTEGNWRAAMLNGQIVMTRSMAQMEFMKARLDAYDAMIAQAERTSNSLGEMALNGDPNPSLIGSAAGSELSRVALEAALQTIP